MIIETVVILLLILWLAGLVSGYTFGGLLHVLLLVALVIFIFRLVTGRRVA